MRRVVSVFLPTWPTDRFGRSQADTAADAAQTPLILARREGSRRLVHAANAAARAIGVVPGMAVSQAQAMLPGLRVEEADPEGDAAALRRLAGWCLRFSPLAAPCAPDGVWIDITGCAHLHGGEVPMLRHLAERLAEAGLAARLAVADTPGCAHAVARHGVEQLAIVPPGQQARAMAGLPVAALRLDEETAAALVRLGFDRVGALAAAPRAPLARRFGATALRRLDQALGRVPEPLEPVLPPDLCRARQGFPEPIATPDDLARATAMLADQLCEKLRKRDEGALRLDLLFLRTDGVPQIIRAGTAAPSRDAAHLARVLTAQLETVDPGYGVETVILSAPLTQKLGAVQTLSDLVAPRGAVGDFSGLVDIIANRVGQARVFHAAPVQSDIPERCVKRVPPLAGVPDGWPDHLPRPPRLLNPARPVEAMALLPDHPPVQFTDRRKPHRIRRADGPERIFGEWWLNAGEVAAVRDYFVVEDEAGQRFWLFRAGNGEDAATGDMRWYLHGYFG